MTGGGEVAAEAHEGHPYVIGGGTDDGEVPLSSVERSRIPPDGSLAPWQMEPDSMVMPRRCCRPVLIDGSTYAIAGFGGKILNSVEHAKLLPAGGGPPRILRRPVQ